MDYKDLVKNLDRIYSTSKRIEKTYYISEFLKEVKKEDIENAVLLLSGNVFPIWDPRKIGIASQLMMKALQAATGYSAEDIKDSWKDTGDLGETAKILIGKKKQSTLFSKKLEINKVIQNLQAIAELEGTGTVDKKIQLIAQLLTSADPTEAKYITKTLLGLMRIGLGEGTLRDALVWAFLPKVYGIFTVCGHCNNIVPEWPRCLECGNNLEKSGKVSESIMISDLAEIGRLRLKSTGIILPSGDVTARDIYNFFINSVQDAYNITNDFGEIAKIMKKDSLGGLKMLGLLPGKPLKVMLAQKAKDIKDAFEQAGKPLAAEYKYDGFRMQVHKNKEGIKIFTRRLEEVTAQFPDVVDFVKKNVSADSFIIEGEAVGYDALTKKVKPFQEISQRIKRKYDIDRLIKMLPVELNIFDIVYYNGKNYLNEPFQKRREVIEKIIDVNEHKIKPSDCIISSDEKEVKEFFEKALKEGHEGIMVKKLDAIYKPGSRVGYMLKVKPSTDTFDLVIVGAEWGEGKRGKWLSSFNLACRDGDDFLLIGKASTGLKEKSDLGLSFEDMTEFLDPLIISSDGKHVTVKPEIIVEVGFQEIQKSPTYGSGFALRFPVVIRIRDDRSIDDITSLDEIKALYSK